MVAAVLMGVALTFADFVLVQDQSALLRFVNKYIESAKEAKVTDQDVEENSYERHKHFGSWLLSMSRCEMPLPWK